MISLKNLVLRWFYLSMLVTNALFCCQLEVKLLGFNLCVSCVVLLVWKYY